MHSQCFTENSLSSMLIRADLVGIPTPLKSTHIKEIVDQAIALSKSGFISYPLKTWHLREKPHFSPKDKATELLMRKITHNLKCALSIRMNGRNSIIKNLRHFIGEGVPYRIYRLDVKSFYESFDIEFIKGLLEKDWRLSPLTLKLCVQLLEHQSSIKHEGLPRGLSSSAIISELAMFDFDKSVIRDKQVHFYSRFVDDIIIITSTHENQDDFYNFLIKSLPPGLMFSDDIEKKKIAEFEHLSNKGPNTQKVEFDYLGYSFAANFNSSSNKAKGSTRDIKLSISEKKISKIKKRIIRALLDFCKNGDEKLLKDRIRLLTSNFSIRNQNSGRYNNAGVFYSYPHIDFPSNGLISLDNFLKKAVLSNSGAVFTKIFACLSPTLRRSLLRHSFVRGFKEKLFCDFSGNRMRLLQSCWKY